MEIDFEKWIQRQKIDDSAKGLFVESIICYKASAYKASLLFSYLGFQTVLRERILSAKPPSGLPNGQWHDIRNSLLSDDKWDPQVFDTTQMTGSKSIFKLTEDVRNQVLYWKNRRNDCAHGKKNEITYAHVDAFWSFIRSNLAKFVVDGSKDGLLNEIKIHFDRSLTPSGSDPASIISKIPTAIENNQVQQFLDETANIVSSLSLDFDNEDVVRFIKGVFDTGSNPVTHNLVSWLKTNFPALKEVLRASPDKIHCFSDDPKFIRKLWYDHLFSSSIGDDMPIYCALLRNKLIPQNEISEAHTRVIEKGATPPTGEDEFQILDSTNFFSILREYAFSQGKVSEFYWANKSTALITYYLGRFEIDKECASVLASVFNSKYNPKILRPSLNKLFSENESKRTMFLNTLKSNDIHIPAYLELEPQKETEEFW